MNIQPEASEAHALSEGLTNGSTQKSTNFTNYIFYTFQWLVKYTQPRRKRVGTFESLMVAGDFG